MKNLKKNVLNEIENIRKERKMSQENERKIKNKIIANGVLSVLMIALIIILLVVSRTEEKTLSAFTYNIGAIQLLILALIILEIGYKKDDGGTVLSGLEILALSIITLFSPYIFLKFSYNAINIIAVIVDLYYIIKILVIYNSEKNRILQEKSDIPDIIKKESKDELVKEFENKRKQELEKEEIKKEPAKRGRKPKSETERKSKTTRTTAKKSDVKEIGDISKDIETENAPKKTTRKKTTNNVDKVKASSAPKRTTKKTSTTSKSKTTSSRAKSTTKKATTTRKVTTSNNEEEIKG